MLSSSPLLFVAALAAVQSFTLVTASADAPAITDAPTPTVAKRQVAGASGTPILSTLKYAYTDLPYQVYPYQVLRGPQYGFNQCNATTLGDTSNCQTLVFNGPVSHPVLTLMKMEADEFTLLRTISASGALLTPVVSLATLRPRSSHTARNPTTVHVSSPQGPLAGCRYLNPSFFSTKADEVHSGLKLRAIFKL